MLPSPGCHIRNTNFDHTACILNDIVENEETTVMFAE